MPCEEDKQHRGTHQRSTVGLEALLGWAAAGVAYQKPLFYSSELKSRGAPAPARAGLAAGSAQPLPWLCPVGNRSPTASARERLSALRRCSATGRCLKSMSAPAGKHVFTSVFWEEKPGQSTAESIYFLWDFVCYLWCILWREPVPYVLGKAFG